MPTLAQTIAQQYREEQKKAKALRGKQHDEFEAAGGYKLTPAQLRGALLPMRNHSDKDLAAWEARGIADLEREAAAAARPKQIVELIFPDGGKGPNPATEMRGLKWVAVLKCWAGAMNIDEARAFAKELHGSLKGDEVLPLAAE